MTASFRKAMDLLYLACVWLAGGSLVLISFVIPWGVFTRYGLNSASSWPEPMAVLLTIVLTFFGAAACYRIGMHMRVAVVRNMLPPLGQKLADFLSEALMGLLAIFMMIWGWSLVDATWYQVIDAFPSLSVGVTYLPIPLGGAVTLAFVLERMLIGAPDLGLAAGAHGGHD